MKKNVVFIEDSSLLEQNYFMTKKKYITFKYISFLFIFLLFILNLYINIKYFNYQKNKDIIFKCKSEEGKNKDVQNIKINNNNDNINFNNIETKDLNILKLIENEIKNRAQLILEEQKFLHGLIRTIKPKKIVEIGVARGGSSVLILNAIKDIKSAKLYSIDKNSYCYLERNKKTGYLVHEKFPELDL
jgi:hypothetical protein